MLSFQADGRGQRASLGSVFLKRMQFRQGAESPEIHMQLSWAPDAGLSTWMPRSGVPTHLTRLSMSISGLRRFSCPASLIPSSPSWGSLSPTKVTSR